MRTTSAVSMATSVPAPMAMPRSAWASAGASLTPSPTMATLRPPCLQLGDLGRLVAGQDLGDDACRCPAVRRSARAVAWLSPVSMTTSMPRSCSAATAAAAVGRGASAMPITPAAWPSTATRTAVRPVGGQLVARGGQLAEVDAFALDQPAVADHTRRPSTSATAPWPGTFSKPGRGSVGDTARVGVATTASASGCSDSRSTAATQRAAARPRRSPSATTRR